jgi:hypothetical protein
MRGARRAAVVLPALLVGVTACLAGAATAGTKLSPARFRALDAVYRTSLPFDKASNTSAEFEAALRACRALTTRDRLLKGFRPGCLRSVQLLRDTQSFAECKGSACRSLATTVRAGAEALVGDMHAMNRAIDRVVARGRCRTVLRASRSDFQDAEDVIAAFKALEHAYATRDPDDMANALQKLDRLGDSSGSDITAAQDRARFRSACR